MLLRPLPTGRYTLQVNSLCLVEILMTESETGFKISTDTKGPIHHKKQSVEDSTTCKSLQEAPL